MFQTPKMKLFNFEQFQFMLNQIQITQLNESTSPSSKNNMKQNPYQILNQIIDRRQTNAQSSNLDLNSYNSQKQLQQCSVSCQQNYSSPKNQQYIFSNTTQNIGQKGNVQSLKQSNSNKSIGAYSSRSNQQDRQQILQQNLEHKKSIKISNSNRNNDLVGTVLNTAPCYSTVEECSDHVRDLNISYEAADETMQMKELSCSIQDDQIEEGIEKQQKNNNYNLNLNNYNKSNQRSSSFDRKIISKNQLNRIEDDKNNPTIISRSNSQNQLDPLLQNLNVKKMCEVQKHYCKKRIREFRQPCEDIVQYQEFIKMINQRCNKENTTNLSSNRRIKTEHSQNSLKQKPPTAQYQFNQSQNSINSHQNILSSNSTQPQQNFVSNCSQTCYNQYQPSFQGCQYQIAQDQIANCNILKPKQNNNQILNTQNETTYSELNSKIFKFKKKNQPSLQENILAHQIQQQHFSQFNSNKENSLCDVTSQKSGIKINTSYNQTQKVNQNASLNNQLSMLIGSRENSISNYDSRNSKSYTANQKVQQKQVPQNVICPAIKQAQQTQLKNIPQKNQSPFYSKGSQQEREQKNIMFREQRTNSNVSYNSKNNTSFNGQQTSKNCNQNIIPLKLQNPPQLNIQNPLISQRSRVSTMEGYERNQCENPQTHNNQKLSNLQIYRQNNISKSSDTTSTNQYYQNLNLITNQTNICGQAQNFNSNKNVVPFNQSYYKRQQQQQQQQQTVKFTKNLKQLNFNCLNYIRKYKEIIELQIVPFMQKIPHDDILEHQNAYKQSLLIMSDQVDISSQEDLQNFQDFLSLRSKNIYNQFLSKYGIMLQI
ncbi:hypothetical protein TTHERM_00522880 (macronuclear) [Tetrahymena thermophila SB210]|uniref:Uncharacterized protein n=1 Tax=Tetrahymena thermophila (strain SB210) TaxID=312017 RepID=I7M7M4_TETTS|nr:hypothetical protein TTHERM_00522880 [Tetrahymena thermophila SB210]EAR94221.2 hypothetical protein TTHERM_00522880 [Tetrahymena thermophila SB210]|eukprot:XP_001014466.2 hypothetical protein TTHERM_00522880 [Tetrahymena thermophila SB210]